MKKDGYALWLGGSSLASLYWNTDDGPVDGFRLCIKGQCVVDMRYDEAKELADFIYFCLGESR